VSLFSAFIHRGQSRFRLSHRWAFYWELVRPVDDPVEQSISNHCHDFPFFVGWSPPRISVLFSKSLWPVWPYF
jgi:hypothetical protein